MAFGSRLKRLNERMMKDVSRTYREQDMEFEARWFPVFYLLKLESSLSITEIAAALRLTHPAINQIAGEMLRAGLLVSTRDKKDERRRLLSLSDKGQDMIAELEPLWADIVAATEEVVEKADAAILELIDRMEEVLDTEGLYDRIRHRIKRRQYDAVDIIDYKPEFKKYFKTLNYEWLEEYFQVEPSDRKILSDPEKKIIAKGGMVVFARLDGVIVGTGAIIKHDKDLYEIAKMAVTATARRRQVGRKLTLTLIDRAAALGASEVFLETSPGMTPAIELYKKFNFKQTEPIMPGRYERESMTMKLAMKNIKKEGVANE